MTEVRNDIFKEGELVTSFREGNLKVSKAIISFDKLLPQLTLEEIHELRRKLAIYILVHDDPDPEFRRELLSQFDSCPCCQTWLGHNRPPDDDPSMRRQSAFDFNR
jgi:hypothetical protein